MAPLLISYGQSIVDDYRKQMLVEEYLREHGHPSGTVAESPTVHAQDDAEVVLDTEINNYSSDISLDQSNNGFSLVNLHWESGVYPRPQQRSPLSIDSGVNYPVARLSAPASASCGLPGCSTTYERPSSVILDNAGAARFLPIGHDALQAISHIPPPPTTIMAPVKPVSPPLLDRDSLPATTASVPSSSRIVPAHSHSNYNRRAFSRSAVPSSVFNLKVTFFFNPADPQGIT